MHQVTDTKVSYLYQSLFATQAAQQQNTKQTRPKNNHKEAKNLTTERGKQHQLTANETDQQLSSTSKFLMLT